MIRRTIATMAALFETGMRVAHITDAAAVIGHDWQAVTHGVANPETVFAVLIIGDTVVHITIWAARKAAEVVKARRERKTIDDVCAASTDVEADA